MSRKANVLSDKFRAMGTDVSIDAVLDGNVSEEKAQKAMVSARAVFEKYEQIFSRFKKDSELSKLNRNIGEEVDISPEMAAVLELCLKYNAESEGYFDPRIISNLEKIGYAKDFRSSDLNSEEALDQRIQLEKIESALQENLIIDRKRGRALAKSRIDTTGIVKGYAVDKAAESLTAAGLNNFIVDAGGDMFAKGLDERQQAWKVDVEGCENPRAMLKLSGEGIATSGISRKRWKKGSKKFHHLINPKSPENFSCDLKTVTVINNKTVEADSKAKVLFLMGVKSGMKFANEHKIKALFLDYCGNIFLSEAIKENIIAN